MKYLTETTWRGRLILPPGSDRSVRHGQEDVVDQSSPLRGGRHEKRAGSAGFLPWPFSLRFSAPACGAIPPTSTVSPLLFSQSSQVVVS